MPPLLYYANGGGLGHLTRARALLHTLGLESEAIIMSASPRLADRRVVGDVATLAVPPDFARDREGYDRWLRVTLEHIRPDRVIVDTFPAGLLHELNPSLCGNHVRLEYVARMMRWDRYVGGGDAAEMLDRFDHVWRVEPLLEEHEQALARARASVDDLRLADPPAEIDAGVMEEGYWLVVHDGEEREVVTLLDLAVELRRREGSAARILVVTTCPLRSLPERCVAVDLYPAHPLFPRAGRIFTAAGFNAMRQARACRDRHIWLPFPRRYDLQEERARRSTMAGA